MTPGDLAGQQSLRDDAFAIFNSALDACDVRRAFAQHLQWNGLTLERRPSRVLHPVTESFAEIKRIQVIAFGEAAIPMLESLLETLPPRIRVDGICSAPTLPAKKHRHIRYFEGGKPLPNKESFRAAEAALDLLRKAGSETFVFFLISGGGSSLLELPQDRHVSLDDVRAFHETLLLSGADITEVNTVRKFFSAVKGGRLAAKAPDARKLTLLLSDVPMKALGAVGSAPTLPNQSTWEECSAILKRWDLLPRFPSGVRAFFERLEHDPPAPSNETIPHNQVDVLLSNHDFVNAARDHARSLGYKVIIDNSCDNCPSEQAVSYLLDRFTALRGEYKRVCLLSSAEVSVYIPEDVRAGCGGRNQHFRVTGGADACEIAEKNRPAERQLRWPGRQQPRGRGDRG